MIKQIFSPHHGTHVKLGRKHPTSRPKLHLKNYLSQLPLPPASCDFSAKALPVLSDIMGNDNLGDCVIAGGYHIVGVETGNASTLYHANPAQIIHDYSAIGGYVPGDVNTDNGCELPVALAYWQKHGFSNGTKLLGHLAVDATDKQEVALACYLFENLYFGMALPDKWINPFPTGNGFIWDVAGAPDMNNGHCIMGMGFDSHGVKVDSWGLVGTLTWEAVAKYASATASGELHVMLSPDQLARGQSKAPNGVNWADLLDDFNQLGGNVPIPPVPVPIPPTPVVKSLSLTQVQALLATTWPK
jgi:hypothetical protein